MLLFLSLRTEHRQQCLLRYLKQSQNHCISGMELETLRCITLRRMTKRRASAAALRGCVVVWDTLLGFLSDAGCGIPRANRPSTLALRAFVTTLAWVSAGRAVLSRDAPDCDNCVLQDFVEYLRVFWFRVLFTCFRGVCSFFEFVSPPALISGFFGFWLRPQTPSDFDFSCL